MNDPEQQTADEHDLPDEPWVLTRPNVMVDLAAWLESVDLDHPVVPEMLRAHLSEWSDFSSARLDFECTRLMAEARLNTEAEDA